MYSLYWKRFNTRGALWSIYGGLGLTLILIIFSPAVSGKATSMLPGSDFAWFPLENPGLVSIPIGFGLAILGTLFGKPDTELADKAVEMEVRSLTGVGVEKAIDH